MVEIEENRDLSEADLAAMPPEDLAAISERVVASMLEIQAQLGTPFLGASAGQPATFSEWNDWRRRAKFALAKRQILQGRIKAVLKKARGADAERNRMIFAERVIGSIQPNARALVRELCDRYVFRGPDDVSLRRKLLKLAEVIFNEPERAELVGRIQSWDHAQAAEV